MRKTSRAYKPSFDQPTHIIDEPGDRHARCGMKDPSPVVWAPYVQAHVDGWAMTVCPDCTEASKRHHPSNPQRNP